MTAVAMMALAVLLLLQMLLLLPVPSPLLSDVVAASSTADATTVLPALAYSVVSSTDKFS